MEPLSTCYCKIEILNEGVLNVRYIVTDMVKAKAKTLYRDIYCARGNAELYIKDHKLYLKSDRIPLRWDHRFAANQFRLLLHSAAYKDFSSPMSFFQPLVK